MTIYRTQPERPSRPSWDERGQSMYHPEESPTTSSASHAVVFLLLLAVAVICVVGFLVVRLVTHSSSPLAFPTFVASSPSPASGDSGQQPTAEPTGAIGQVAITINPERGYINTLVTVTGQGWWPGEPVFVFLRSKDEGDARGYSYAAAVADEQGNMRTAFTFPNETRWIGQEWADVIARGNRSQREATTRFTLAAPTPTNTLPPPTPRPTLPPTDTPPVTDTPLPTATPTATATPEVVITDWRGEYYANTTLSGDPVFIRNDVIVDFGWGAGSPGEGIPADQFSARWTRRPHFRGGTYHFAVTVDDGARLWIDGRLHIDEWHDSTLATYSLDIDLTEGEHALQLEYYENLGGAAVQLSWERITPTETPSPTSTPSPTATPTSTPTFSPTPTPTPTFSPTATPSPTLAPPPLPAVWQAEYYDNLSLQGQPVLVREEAELNHDWGAGSPAKSVPTDNFSARWRQEVRTMAGTYRFFLDVDDGVRLWVDGLLLIDEWHEATGDVYQTEVDLPEGVHRLEIEYYEATFEARIHFWKEMVPNPSSTSP